MTFGTSLSELYINATLVYNFSSGILDGSGWKVSQDGKTFTKTYERKSIIQNLSVKAIGENGECSIINNLFEIPQLTPVDIDGEPVVTPLECDLTVTLRGTSGMTVIGTPSNDKFKPVILHEGQSGIYTASFPRKFSGYTIDISAAKAGAGTVTKKVEIQGKMLLPAEPFTHSFVASGNNGPGVRATFNNPHKKTVEVVLTRGSNSSKGKERSPWVEGAPGVSNSKTIILPPDGSISLNFNKDVADDFSMGYYTVTMVTTSYCGETYRQTKRIENQRDFCYGFRKITDPANPGDGGYPGGGGSEPSDPDYPLPTPEEGYTIFEVTVSDAIPGVYVQFLLNTSNGFGSVWGSGKKTDANGNLKILVKMKNTDISIANGKKGEFKFSKDKFSTSFISTKEITFNLQL